MREQVYELATEFSSGAHGSSNYGLDEIYIKGKNLGEYVPLSYLSKKIPEIKTQRDLKAAGFVYSSADFLDEDSFKNWYQEQFNRKVTLKSLKEKGILHYPDELTIFGAVEKIVEIYDVLRDRKVINNGKNLPVQLGEWYAKCVFGLKQVKSSSQRGFDFFNDDGKKVEVIIDWNDRSSPKGVKLKKSLVDMSDFCIVIYISRNFMMRDVLMLDSSFIMRKYAGKGHTIFLKDSMVSGYFFSIADKQFNHVVNKNFLMKFSSGNFAMKLDGRL